MIGDEDVGAALVIGAALVLAVATIYTWGRLAKRRMRRCLFVKRIDEAISEPEHHRAARF